MRGSCPDSLFSRYSAAAGGGERMSLLKLALALLIAAAALDTTAIATGAFAKPISKRHKSYVSRKPVAECTRRRPCYAVEPDQPQFERDEPFIICVNAPCG